MADAQIVASPRTQQEARLDIDTHIAQNELAMMQFALQRLEDSRREKMERLSELRSYYHSLKQESAMRTIAIKESQYPLLWLCTGLSIGVLFLVTKALLINM